MSRRSDLHMQQLLLLLTLVLWLQVLPLVLWLQVMPAHRLCGNLFFLQC
jgi:hypothetical protein